ncbi:MAG TPA: Hsp20/alpha crystallin family protein [Vicinamibacteria bacterium]|nr:Hsp20/alpha crystallin family protein [Vicinamibacteria bacterium]
MTRRAPRPPISALALLQQEMGELVHRLSVLERADRLPGSEWSPAVDVFEARDRLVVVIEVPGLPPESLRVVFRERALVLAGERRARRPGPGCTYLCLERPHGRFERAIPIEVPVDVAQARGTLAGGLLVVTLPRLRERRGRETVVPIERERPE